MADPYWRYTASADRAALPGYIPSDASTLPSQSWRPSYSDLSTSSILQTDITGSRLGVCLSAQPEPSSNGYPSSWEDRYLTGRRDVIHGTEPVVPNIINDRPDSLRKDDGIQTGHDSNVLFVDALPSDCSRREVSHLFRPFRGFKEIRLVHKEPRNERMTLVLKRLGICCIVASWLIEGADKAMVLCFVEFTDSNHALTALEALQGYKFDNKKPDSPALRIHFAHFPFQLPSDDTHIPSQTSPDSVRFPSKPPPTSAHFSSKVLHDSAVYSSKLPHDSAHFPSQQPLDSAHFPSQQPRDGANISSLQSRDSAYIPSQQPRDSAYIPSQQPRDSAYIPSQQPRDSAHFPSQQPRDSAYIPSQQPRDSAHFSSQLLRDSAHFSSQQSPNSAPFSSQLPPNSVHSPFQLPPHRDEQDLANPREKELAAQDEEPVVMKKKKKRGSFKNKEKSKDFENQEKKFCIKCKQNHFGECYSFKNCYVCGNPGHIGRDCTSKPRLCYGCGEPGHIHSLCPNGEKYEKKGKGSETLVKKGGPSKT